MEPVDGEVAETKYSELTVDFSKQELKKIERASNGQQSAVVLILDDNELPRLENLESYPHVEQFSAANNQIIRMYGVCHLTNLHTLDLSNNLLVTIEGLKGLTNLRYLNLAKNRIKTIEHLNGNLMLEKVDLSENNIIRISDVSHLKNLKEFYLHGNRITHLVQCDKYLPHTIEILTLNNNSLADLNEISYLVHLNSLKELSISNNPCLDFREDQKFTYRPFVKNWCTNLVILDNSPLDDIECLKAEWLYSQGRGRSFRPGEHTALIEYLMSVCPREKEENAETEDVKKLKLILSKAQLHQQQLREQLSTGKIIVGDNRPALHRKRSIGFSERMVTSCQDTASQDVLHTSDLMSRSLDSGMGRRISRIIKPDVNQTPLQTSTTFIPIPDTLISPDVGHPVTSSCPTVSSISTRTSRSSSRNSQYSAPENRSKMPTAVYRRQSENSSTGSLKMSGKLSNSRSSTPLDLIRCSGKTSSSRSVAPSGRKVSRGRDSEGNQRETSEEEESDSLGFKIKAIHQRAAQRRSNKVELTDATQQTDESLRGKPSVRYLADTKAWKAAVCIQRRWRGYRARNLNNEVLMGCKNIQMNRMQDYLTKVVGDMEATRAALDGNRKLVVLQMQAINSLWKKMSTLHPTISSDSEEGKTSLQNLVETCSTLTKQVEGLQNMMKAMQMSPNPSSLIPTSTQTEIVAVHTPQECKNIFPYSPSLRTVESYSWAASSEKEENNLLDCLNDSESYTVKEETNEDLKESASETKITESESTDSIGSCFQIEKLLKPITKLEEDEEKSFNLEEESENPGFEELQNNRSS